MTMTTLEPRVDGGDTDAGDLTHLYCMECYPDADAAAESFCGQDVYEDPDLGEFKADDADPDLCVVCIDLAKYPCERCGA